MLLRQPRRSCLSCEAILHMGPEARERFALLVVEENTRLRSELLAARAELEHQAEIIRTQNQRLRKRGAA